MQRCMSINQKHFLYKNTDQKILYSLQYIDSMQIVGIQRQRQCVEYEIWDFGSEKDKSGNYVAISFTFPYFESCGLWKRVRYFYVYVYSIFFYILPKVNVLSFSIRSLSSIETIQRYYIVGLSPYFLLSFLFSTIHFLKSQIKEEEDNQFPNFSNTVELTGTSYLVFSLKFTILNFKYTETR